MDVGNFETSTVRTSVVTVITSPHGLQRRLERKIGIRDLQAAVKHGTREPGFPCPRTGELRWRYTYADVVYVTDETSKREITSWPTPAAGLDLQTVQVRNYARISGINLNEFTWGASLTGCSVSLSHSVGR